METKFNILLRALAALSLLVSSCNNVLTDIDGNRYDAVKIGDQVWMSSNLNVTRFRNGDSIPEAVSKEDWIKYGQEGRPAYCVIQNMNSAGIKYGKLYNWFAVVDPRGLAPKGWHIPSDEEWTSLTDYLGGGVAAAMRMRVVNSYDGKNSDEAGFSGLPGGARALNGNFYGFESFGYWWSGTESVGHTAWMRVLDYNIVDINSLCYNKICGLSVRCIRN
jgi:uncharacterized protein (TIGR02145 family)